MRQAPIRVPRRLLFLLLKIAISGGLLAWVLFDAVDWRELPAVLAQVNIALLGFTFLLCIPAFVVSALRWQAMLRRQDVRVRLLPLIDSCVVSCFYNMILPTRVGGDVARILDLRGANNSLAKSASSVLVERLFGISILFAFAVVAALLRLPLAREIPAVPIALALGGGGLTAIILFMYSNIVSRVLKFVPSQFLRDRLSDIWERFHSNAVFLMRDRAALAAGLGYSFLLQILVVLNAWLIGLSIGFDIPLLDYFFLVPVQLIILMLPTINGLGLREASSILLFGIYGVSAAEAVTFSFIELLFMALLFVAGWVRLITRRSLPTAIATSAEIAPVTATRPITAQE